MERRIHRQLFKEPMTSGMGGIETLIVGVSVAAIDAATVPIGDPLDWAFRGLNIEGARSPDRDSAGMDTPLLPFRDHCFNQIAGPESMNGFGPRQVAAREPVFRHPRSLISAPAGRFDVKDRHCPGFEFTHAANACRVQSMGFGDQKFHPVKLGQASGEGSDWQPGLT